MKNSFAFTLLGQTCLFVALLLGGCAKEKDPAPAQPSCRVVTSNSVSGLINFTTRYTYDGANKLTGSVTDVENRKQSNANYEYNQKGQLSKYVTEDYRYDGNLNVTVITRTYRVDYNEKGQVSGYQLTTTSTDPATLPSTSTSTYEYDSQGYRTKVTTQSGNNAPTVDLHEYKDGNCIKTTFRAGEPGAAIIAYEHYLDREFKSRNMAHIGIFGPSANKNMVRKSTQTIADNPDYAYVSERTYEFNEKGFPVKTSVTSTSSNGITSTSVSASEYACQ